MSRIGRGLARASLLGIALLAGFEGSMTLAGAQTRAELKADARAFARGLIPGVKRDASTTPTADTMPGYRPGTPPEAAYYSDPDRLDADKASAAASNEAYGDVRASSRQKATIPQADLDATITRSVAIQDNPNPYVSGFTAGGTSGSCHELPPGAATACSSEQACNTGVTLGDAAEHSCTIGLRHQFTSGYRYSCGYAHLQMKGMICRSGGVGGGKCFEPDYVDEEVADLNSCQGFEAAPQCTLASETFIDNARRFTADRYPYVSTVSNRVYDCTAPASSTAAPGSSLPFWRVTPAPPVTLASGRAWVRSDRDETQCRDLPPTNETCEEPSEVCTDSAPQTRIVEGVAVTQSCWSWKRTYQCRRTVTADDCSGLRGMGCTFKRRECLTDDSPCRTYEDVYQCPNPVAATGERQYICDGEVYCINGECETIERTANNEFGQAAVALNAAAQAGREFDPATLKIFDGTRNTCSKTIAGLTNCCAPRGLPIVGGGCSSEDKILKKQREKGLCHYVGSYCSSSILGVCLKKKEAHCCYASKLSRIIQEQGRPQLGLAFGTAKRTVCDGFTIEQFQRLDLSRMDFSEVMAEFTDAARLPDELSTANDLQARITAYYAAHPR